MTFDVEKFRAVYPQFANLSDAQLEFMWGNALIISGIEEDTRIPESQKENLLFMLVCHLATLATRGTTGTMTGATQGSVSVTYAAPVHTGDAAWYNSTPCGAAYWQIVKKYRLGGLWFPGRKRL